MKVEEVVRSQLFRIKLFTSAECRSLLSDIDLFRADNSCAPNSMNRYGVILGGPLRKLFADLSAKHVQPLSPVRLRKHPIAFAVDYSTKTQRSLAKHFDESAMTLNVCLGNEFEGGSLLFYPGGWNAPSIEVEQKPGFALIHSGQLVHRATALTSGTRTNLVMWCQEKKSR